MFYVKLKLKCVTDIETIDYSPNDKDVKEPAYRRAVGRENKIF